MNNNPMREEKIQLRKKSAAIRDEIALDKEKKASLDNELTKRFTSLASYRFAKTLLIYSPIKSEIDVRPIMENALAQGKKVALPCCSKNGDHTMVFRYINSSSELAPGLYGVLEPPENAEAYIPEEDLSSSVCIVPALAFDKDGYRLGYGGGYYDRFLPKFKQTTVGLVYSSLLIEKIPRSRFDSNVDVIITEKGVTLTGER